MHLRFPHPFTVLLTTALAAAQGPGLGNLRYTPDELGKPISVIQHREGHSLVNMHRGYLIAVFSRDGGQGEGGISIIDVSNPRKPVILHNEDNVLTSQLRESHAWGFREDIACLQADSGVQFWDFSQPLKPKRLSYLKIPGISRSDYDFGLWWTHWQGRYVYGGGSSRGLVIIDAEDPSNPKFVKTLSTSQVGGFRVGSTHAIGNLLILTGFDNPAGISVLDISDPLNPSLIQKHSAPSSYSSMVNGNRIVLGARHRPSDAAVVYTLSNTFTLIRAGNKVVSDTLGGGYVNFSDGYAFTKGRKGFVKIDLSNSGYPVIFRGGAAFEGADEGFPTPLGNIVFSGNDHKGAGSALIPHQIGPDTVGPLVNMVVPRDKAINQALTTRIGLTFSDQLDGRSIDTSSVSVRPLGGKALEGYYANQTGIVNFHPSKPLLPNTTYEITVRAGGVRDYAGNSNPVAFRSTFSTGSSLASCWVQSGSPASTLGDTAVFTADCNGTADSVTWNFGDGGSSKTHALKTPARHVYVQEGIFQVSALVHGQPNTISLLHTVLRPQTPLKPARSTTILLDPLRGLVWNVNVDNNSVTASSTHTYGRLHEIGVGRAPRTLTQDSRGRIWVANQESASLSIIDSTWAVRHTLQLPRASRPYGVAYSQNLDAIYVTLEATGEILKLNPNTLAITHRTQTVPSPRGIAVSHDGNTLLVSRFISGRTSGEVAEHNASDLTYRRTIPLPEDFTADTDNSGAGVPNAIASVTISPDGRTAWVPFKKDNIRRGLLNPLASLPLTFENTVRTGIAILDLSTGLELTERRIDLDNRSLANAVEFDQRGNFAYITTGASNHTSIVKAITGSVVSAIEPGKAWSELGPDGLALLNDTLLFVHYGLSRQIGVYSVTEAGASNIFPQRALISTVERDNLSADVLRGKQIFHNAADRRMSKDNYLSCVVCHMDGGSDARIWDFTHKGEGLRRTTSLLGRGGLQHGPLHWSANFDEIQDFEHDIRNDFGGEGFLANSDFRSSNRDQPLGGKKAGLSPDLDALAAYLNSLTSARPSPYRLNDGTMSEDAKAGEIIFNRKDVGCATCHVPPAYTNSRLTSSSSGQFPLFDVGTLTPSSGKRLGAALTGLDTPTLLGVWEGGPYLHNGLAGTLMDVLTVYNPADKHGRTSILSDLEKRQLVAFLQQIESSVNPPVTLRNTHPMNLSYRKIGTTFLFQLKTPDDVRSLEIFSSEGHLIGRAPLTAGSPQGEKTFHWKPNKQPQLPVGIYYVTYTSNNKRVGKGFLFGAR